MTGNAGILFERRMHVSGIELQILNRVAGVAKLVPFLLQEELTDDPVAEMAVLTLSVFHAGMDVLHREILVRELLVAVEAFLALEFPLLRERRRCKAQEEKSGAEESRCNE